MPKIALDQIVATAGTQIRVKIDPAVVDEYASGIDAGEPFPLMVVYCKEGGSEYVLADGFHRLAALTKLGRKTAGVEVKIGGLHEALAYALSANTTHGLRRTSADKTHAVQMALKDPAYSESSLREIADVCKVSHELVRTVKEKNSPEPVTPRPRKEPPSQNDIDRKELLGAIATIRSFPFAGDSAWHRLSLEPDIDDITYLYDWLDEVLAEHDKQVDGPDD